MLLWSEQFETGHPLIDTQHKLLISYINRLGGIAKNTNPDRQEAEFIIRFIGFMEVYIDVHFKCEEDCMDSYQCPVRGENKEAHREFLIFFRQFKLRFEAEGFRPEVLSELHESCRTWIQNHIMQIDVQLKPCLSQPPAPDNQG